MIQTIYREHKILAVLLAVLISTPLFFACGGSSECTSKAVICSSVYDQLMKEAEANGSVEVIIGLDVHWDIHTGGSEEEAIAKVQQEVLDSLNGLGVSEVIKYTYVPQMAMRVTPEALSSLGRNPLVTDLSEDGLLSPA